MSAQQIIFINLFFYLLGFGVLLFVRHRISEQSVGLFSITLSILGVLFSLGLSITESVSEILILPWFSIGNLSIPFEILFNELTVLLYFIVQFVGLLVQVFSVKYMKKDEDFGKYYAFLNLFIFSMLGVVVSGNLLILYGFWELVGLSSYLLIGFWYKKTAAINASKKAFLVNRIGDIGFLIGIFLVYQFFGTVSIQEITNQASSFFSDGTFYSATNKFNKESVLTTAGLLVFCGCIGKSAQFPLQIWLPDAMEGPTPVSALIHAATMVVAGVFMMARLAHILTPSAGFVIVLVGITTSLLAAYSALFQYDIKKVLAYSTVSQLGLMVVGIGVGATNATIFHLTTHAFFKAGLFLSAGAVIHHLHHEQDMRKMGNLRREMPIVFWSFGVCAAALAGLPFFSGFLSKDAILIAAFQWASEQGNDAYFAIPVLAIISSALTAYYITRQYILVFFEREGSTWQAIKGSAKRTYANFVKGVKAMLNADDVEIIEEENFYSFMRTIGSFEIPILMLAFASTFLVYSINPFSMTDTTFTENFPMNENTTFHWVGYATLLVAVASIWIAYIFTKDEIHAIRKTTTFEDEPKSWFAKIGFHHFYLNDLYHIIFVEPFVGASYLITEKSETSGKETKRYFFENKGLSYYFHLFDSQWIDKLVDSVAKGTVKLSAVFQEFEKLVVDGFVNAVANWVRTVGAYTRQFQGGNIQMYLTSLFALVVLFILLILGL